MASDTHNTRRSSDKLGLAQLKGLAVTLIFALLPAHALGEATVEDTLGEDASVFEGYRYAIFTVDAGSVGTTLYFGSEDFDAYLLAVGPDDQILENDDGHLENVSLPPASSVLTLGQEGRWVVVATTYSSGRGGAYILGASDSSTIHRVAPGGVDGEVVARAFRARNVISEAERLRVARVANEQEISELAEQLSLPSYRRLLKESLESAQKTEAALENRAANSLQLFSAEVAELEAAREEVQNLEESRELVEAMIEERLRGARRSLQSAEQAQVSAATRKLGFEALMADLQELEAVAEEIEVLDNELLRESDIERIVEIQGMLVELRGRGTVLGLALAEQLFDTEIVRRIRFSGFGAVQSYILASLETTDRYIRNASENVIAGDFAEELVAERWFDARRVNAASLLPDLLPFPPPVATHRAMLDPAVFGDKQPQNFGHVVDQLHALFRDAGYGFGRHGFLGVPNGFAIMTIIEQHDADGVPLEGEARWSANVLPIKRLSVWSIVASLFEAPAGYYRVIVVILTDRSIFNPDPAPAQFALLQAWSRQGNPDFPVELRDEPITQSHRTYFLVYEFKKTFRSELAEYNKDPNILLESHLSHTKFAAYVN